MSSGVRINWNDPVELKNPALGTLVLSGLSRRYTALGVSIAFSVESKKDRKGLCL